MPIGRVDNQGAKGGQVERTRQQNRAQDDAIAERQRSVDRQGAEAEAARDERGRDANRGIDTTA